MTKCGFILYMLPTGASFFSCCAHATRHYVPCFMLHDPRSASVSQYIYEYNVYKYQYSSHTPKLAYHYQLVTYEERGEKWQEKGEMGRKKGDEGREKEERHPYPTPHIKTHRTHRCRTRTNIHIYNYLRLLHMWSNLSH